MERVDIESVMEANPNSRFRVVDNPNLSPGTCMVCGSSGGDDRQFIDTTKTVDYFGVVYICTFCIAEAAKLLGMEPSSNWHDAEKRLQEEISKIDDLYVKSKVDLDAARTLLRNCTCCDDDNLNPRVPDSMETDSESEQDDSDSGESSDFEGFGDISEPSGDDEPPTKSPRRKRRTSEPDE